MESRKNGALTAERGRAGVALDLGCGALSWPAGAGVWREAAQPCVGGVSTAKRRTQTVSSGPKQHGDAVLVRHTVKLCLARLLWLGRAGRGPGVAHYVAGAPARASTLKGSC